MLQIAQPGPNTTAALLKINGLNLLLPQGEIRTLESAADINPVAPAMRSIGWIAYARKSWPVYCLSEELALMDVVPKERRACVMLTMGAGYLGVMCDDMMVLKDFAVQRYGIPAAMSGPDTPILHVLPYEEGIACASNASKLTAYIGKLVLAG